MTPQDKINDWKNRLDIFLEESFKTFLITQNGGEPSLKSLHIKTLEEEFYIIINKFFRLDEIEKDYHHYNNIIPQKYLPIARDEFGNRICIVKDDGKGFGQIYYYDLRWDLEEGEDADVFAYKIAANFDELLTKLRDHETSASDRNLMDIFTDSFENEQKIIDLVNSGWDTNSLLDENGYTAIQRVVLGNKLHLAIAQLLIEKGAKLNGTLEQASVWNNLEAMQFLLDNGADINEKDQSGDTLLIKMVKGLNLELIEFLLTNGADVNAKDQNQKNAIDWAKEKKKQGHKKAKEIIKLLKKHK